MSHDISEKTRLPLPLVIGAVSCAIAFTGWLTKVSVNQDVHASALSKQEQVNEKNAAMIQQIATDVAIIKEQTKPKHWRNRGSN